MGKHGPHIGFNPCSDGSTDLVHIEAVEAMPFLYGFNPCSDGSTDLVPH